MTTRLVFACLHVSACLHVWACGCVRVCEPKPKTCDKVREAHEEFKREAGKAEKQTRI